VSIQSTEPAATEHNDRPLATEQVLIEEALAINSAVGRPLPEGLKEAARRTHGRLDQKLGVEGDEGDAHNCVETATEQHKLYHGLNQLDRAALCLSGGGIRSAAFSLGVIQALATHPRPKSPLAMFEAPTAPDGSPVQLKPQIGIETGPYNVVADPKHSLLAQMQYLSTVSGGGYIGSWLSAWRSRTGLAAVWSNLVGRPCGPDIEPSTIGWLRAYSNYLTPKLGALSGDTWAGVAISLRNLLLNWLVIIPAICVVILLLKMVAAVSIGVAVLPPSNLMAVLFAALAITLLVIALRFTTRNRPSLRAEDMRDKLGRPLGVDQGEFIRWDLFPATLAAGAFIQLGASNSGLAVADHHSPWAIIAVTAIASALVYAISWLVACPERREWKDFWLWTLSGTVYGALLGTGISVYNQVPSEGFLLFNDLLLPVMFGVPWMLISQMVAEMLFVGLSSYQRADRVRTTSGAQQAPAGSDPRKAEVGSHDDSESDREWLGRAAGWYLVTALGWLVITFLIFAGSLAVTDFAHVLERWLVPLGGVGGFVTATLGKSQLSQGRGAKDKGGAKPLSINIIIGIAALLFGAALLVFLSATLDELLLGDSLVILLRYPGVQIFVPFWWARAIELALGLVIAGVLVWAVVKSLNTFLKSRRCWQLFIFVFVGPILAAVVVAFLPVVLDIVARLLNLPSPPDPDWLLTSEAWDVTGPLLVGLVITGIVAFVAAKRVGLERLSLYAFVAPVFAFVVIVIAAAALELLAQAASITLTHPGLGIFSPGWFKIFAALLVGFVLLGAVTWIASKCININRFSLHAIYRNRLVRAFLGSSRPKRNPDAFSGFDEDDNPAMSSLWPPRHRDGSWPAVKEWRPFHVINMALNIVSTHHLSWQERKAESFTVSPLHSGSACKAYRRSSGYGGKKGISLGTAMAISGAAASPNMGYHSSPPITFLLALFNVRLGWWLGNPGKEGQETYRDPGPALALQPLIEETFGLTTDERPFVYLSDGGHFENLGLYEMVRRRCRYIVAVDAGADADYGFEDLGNAVRKIAIDLGVKIRFHGLDRLKKRDPACPDLGAGVPYHAIGEIDYPAADGGGEDDFGIILYIKPGYHGIENADVRAYAIANPTFPHQGTGDQFFSESQFESYRALGFEIADGIFTHVLDELPDRSSADLKKIFLHLRDETQRSFKQARAAAKQAATTDARETGSSGG
jgi:hypothetical protein